MYDDKLLLFLSALLLDLIVGEPPEEIHPVVITGKIISKVEKKIKNRMSKFYGITFGFLLLIIANAAFFGLYFISKKILGLVGLDIFADIFFLKSTFSIKSLVEHSSRVFEELRKGEIEKARKEVSKIVSRKTDKLEKPHIISATVESVAENTVDSFFSPVIFFLIFGIPGSIFYRVVNTLDAMVGYKNERYKFIGLIPAKLDDILNFLPARLSVIFILIGSVILKMKTGKAIRTLLDFGKATESPNSYIPMTLFSGALGIKLEKIGFYSIGNFDLPQSEEVIRKANKLALTSCIVFSVIAGIVLIIFRNLSFRL